MLASRVHLLFTIRAIASRLTPKMKDSLSYVYLDGSSRCYTKHPATTRVELIWDMKGVEWAYLGHETDWNVSNTYLL